MQTPETEVKMTQDPERTKMVAKQKKIKLKFERDTLLRSGSVARPGTILELDEDEAKEILAFRVEGNFNFSGERDGTADKQIIRKATVHQDTDAA